MGSMSPFTKFYSTIKDRSRKRTKASTQPLIILNLWSAQGNKIAREREFFFGIFWVNNIKKYETNSAWTEDQPRYPMGQVVETTAY